MSKWKTMTNSAEETQEFGQKLAEQLKGGEIIELMSDLGGGKTTLTKGLVKGIGSDENVTSPTFVVSKVYKGTALELHHYDFYRLEEAGLMEDEMQDVMNNSNNITVVEWAGRTHNLFPKERLISIELKPQENEFDREINITVPESYDEVLEGMGAQKC